MRNIATVGEKQEGRCGGGWGLRLGGEQGKGQVTAASFSGSRLQSSTCGEN